MDGAMTIYRVMVSREAPWWTAVAYGPGLPEHGAATETRTIADIEEKIRDLIVLRTDADLRMPYEDAVHGFDLDYDYDLPTEVAEALEEYRRSRRELTEAQDRYTRQSQRAALALTTTSRASTRDAAALMGISFQRVSQLLTALRGQLSQQVSSTREPAPKPLPE
jgi:hypothetical protein